MSRCIRKKEAVAGELRRFVLEDLSGSVEAEQQCAENGCVVIPAGPVSAAGAGHGGRPFGREDAFGNSPKQNEAEIAQQAYEEGFAQGHRDGLELARKEMAATIDSLVGIMEALERWKAEICVQAEEQVLELAISLAEEIIRHEVCCSSETVKETVRLALQKAAAAERAKICLHPEDLEIVKEFLPEISQKTEQDFTLEASHAVERGGCLIETDCGIIDARLGKQWQILKRQLRKALEDHKKTRCQAIECPTETQGPT
ncbi:MAG: flagellar assembly protein FliH [Deltaproteobacteria bacterium]|nr:flagellar assembly protein FliH [Deltaproteobacteria bacterium]MBW2069732.1 flagellar assembly protein FliH [Deltaproteobacteria bacterium]